jgi:hypothetical protein
MNVGEQENVIKVCVEKHEKRDDLEDLGVNGIITSSGF